MPGMDGTGPYGTGPVGLGLGPCGRGLRRAGLPGIRYGAGRGIGYGRGFGLGYAAPIVTPVVPAVDDQTLLEAQAARLEAMLAGVRAELNQRRAEAKLSQEN